MLLVSQIKRYFMAKVNGPNKWLFTKLYCNCYQFRLRKVKSIPITAVWTGFPFRCVCLCVCVFVLLFFGNVYCDWSCLLSEIGLEIPQRFSLVLKRARNVWGLIQPLWPSLDRMQKHTSKTSCFAGSWISVCVCVWMCRKSVVIFYWHTFFHSLYYRLIKF